MDSKGGCSHPPKMQVEDEHGGETVCGGCGTVVSERNPARGTGRFRHGEEGDKSHDSVMKKYDSGTAIGHPDKKGRDIYKMRRTDSRTVNHRSKSTRAMRDRIMRINDALDLPGYVAETALGLYEKASKKDALIVKEGRGQGANPNKRVGCMMRGGAADSAVCGIYYAALKIHGIKKPIGDIASATGVGKSKIFKEYKKLYLGLGLSERVVENIDEMTSMEPYVYMAKISNYLGMPEARAMALASHVAKKYGSLTSEMKGGKPAVTVGALFLMAHKYSPDLTGGAEFTHDGLSGCIGATGAGIRHSRARLEKFVRDLYRAEGVDVDRFPVEDRPAKRPDKVIVKKKAPAKEPAAEKPAQEPPGYLRPEVDYIVRRLALGEEARGGVYRVYGMLADGKAAPRAESRILRAASIVYAGCKITPGYEMSIKEFSRKVGIGQSSIFGTYRKIYDSVPEIEKLVKGAMKK